MTPTELIAHLKKLEVSPTPTRTFYDLLPQIIAQLEAQRDEAEFLNKFANAVDFAYRHFRDIVIRAGYIDKAYEELMLAVNDNAMKENEK